MPETAIALIFGFAAGYGVREWVSCRRREAAELGGMTGIQTFSLPRSHRRTAASSNANTAHAR